MLYPGEEVAGVAYILHGSNPWLAGMDNPYTKQEQTTIAKKIKG